MVAGFVEGLVTCRSIMYAAVLLCTLGSAASASDWTVLDVDAERNRYSVDQASVRREGQRVTARVRTEYARPREDGAIAGAVYAVVDTLVFDCGTASFALASRSLVAADLAETQTIANAREDLRFRRAAAGSMSERILRHVCGARMP